MNTKDFFLDLNEYYWKDIQHRDSLVGLLDQSEWVQSLLHFADYAFQRQGSPPVYRDAAEAAIRANSDSLASASGKIDTVEQKVFACFRRFCEKENVGLNLRINPMAPTFGGLDSLVRFAYHTAEGYPVAAWAESKIKQGRTETAHSELLSIRGIGPKIASLYLRDIYLLSQTEPVDPRQWHYLQPIDVWTWRASCYLKDSETLSDGACADALNQFEGSFGLRTGESNVGFWVLGSQICRTAGRFEDMVRGIGEGDVCGPSQILQEEHDTVYGLGRLLDALRSHL